MNQARYKNSFFNMGIIFLFIFIIFIRFHNLAADPPNWKRVGDVFDEGLWAMNPRNGILFGQWFLDEQNTSLGSPLFAFLLYISFKFLGVGFFSARIVSALVGTLTVGLFYLCLKKIYNKKTALLGLFIFGLNQTFLMYNRLALVETVIMFFVFLTLISLYKGKMRGVFYFWAGISFAFVCLAKFFNVIYAFPLFCIWLYENWESLRHKKIKESLKSLILCAIGFLVIVIPFYIFHLRPYADIYKSIYEVFQWHAIHFSSIKDVFHIIALGLSQAFAEQIFTQLPVSLLLVFVIFFLLSWLDQIGFSFKRLWTNLHPVTVYCGIFLMGGWFASMPFGFIDRRQVVFILPFSFIVTRIICMILWEKPPANLSRNLYSCKQFLIILIIFGYALWSFVHVLWRKNNVFAFPFADKYSGFILLAIGIVVLLCIAFAIGKYFSFMRNELSRWILFFSALLLIMLPLGQSLKVVGEVLAGMGFLAAESSFVTIYGIMIIAVIAVLCWAIFPGRFFLAKAWQKSSVLGFLITYFFVNAIAIYLSVFSPTMTLYAESKDLGTLLPPGTVVKGSFSHSMAFENKIYPFFPHQKGIDTHIPDREAAYYLIAVNIKGGTERDFFLKGHEKLVAGFKVLPYLFSNKYRVFLELYEDPAKNKDFLITIPIY